VPKLKLWTPRTFIRLEPFANLLLTKNQSVYSPNPLY
jgi:hypothetical protein